MNLIKIQNDYSWLISEDDELKTKLWSSLRFREKNYFHSRLYKQKLWDGYTDFFNKLTGKFLTGLLPEVTAALKILKSEYEINDCREVIGFNIENVDEDFLGNDITLYDYQVDFINQIIKNKRGIIYSPTSSGKTFIMVGTLKALPPNTPTLVLANRKSLVSQNYEEIKKWGFKDIGRLYDKYKEPNMITCATVQSLHKIEKLLPKIQVVIVDEIHENMSRRPKAIYKKLKSASVRIALSATPFKFGGKDKTQKYSVKGFFGPVLKTKASKTGILTTKSLQDRNILAPSKATFYPINEPQLPYDIYLDAVTHGIAESWHFHEIVSRLTASLKGRTLILVDRLAHGDALKSLLPNSLWVQGKDDIETRKKVIEQLQKSKDDVVAIATQGIFNSGINVFTHNLINAAGGQADHQIIQRMGRGLRTADDKEILQYYDFVFNINDYLLEHSRKRIKILTKEGHDVTTKEEIDF
jgi:superfamily II DNA or RNA helicase